MKYGHKVPQAGKNLTKFITASNVLQTLPTPDTQKPLSFAFFSSCSHEQEESKNEQNKRA